MTYTEARREARRRHDAKRKRLIREARERGERFSTGLFRWQKEYFGLRCAYCLTWGGGGAASERLSEDHVVPLSQGGAHDLTNIVPACKRCNTRKADLSLLLWLRKERESWD